MTIITSRQLWDKYDRFTPSDPIILRENKTEFIDRKLYFSGFKAGGGTVRCYARYIAPLDKNPPVLIALLPFDQSIDDVDANKALQAGYAVLLLDYAGKSDKKTHSTIYPRSINAVWETDPDSIKKPTSDARTSCHYYWTTCVLHAITYLESQGFKDKIGIIGIKEGAGLVFKTGLIGGIKAGATFFGGDIWGAGEEYLAYKAALDSRAYADTCFPVLINTTTNEKNGASDYLNDLHTSAPASRFLSFANAETAVSKNQRQCLKKWFDTFFYGGELPPRPELNVFCSEGALYAEVIGEYESVRIYKAEDRAAFCRNWSRAEVAKIGENKFLIKLSVADAALPLLVYANVTYADGFVFSTPIVAKNPQKMGVRADSEKNRIVYRAESARDTWLAENGGFFVTNSVEVKKGPFDLEGISGNELITFAPGDTCFKGGKESLLQIIIHSPVIQDVEFTVTVLDGQSAEYKCKKALSGNGWTTITLSAEDFKSQKGIPSFNKAVGLGIKGKELIVNSVVWI